MSPVAGISRVLVGVDFDEASASALKMAGVLGSWWDAGITVFHSSASRIRNQSSPGRATVRPTASSWYRFSTSFPAHPSSGAV